jgi:hypothetical protein
MAIRNRSCAVHRHREYVPIEAHHIWPKGEGGPDISSNLIDICANAHSAVHEYLRLLKRHNGKPPLRDKARYGYKTRRLALQGWRMINAQG